MCKLLLSFFYLNFVWNSISRIEEEKSFDRLPNIYRRAEITFEQFDDAWFEIPQIIDEVFDNQDITDQEKEEDE
jgi:hypothetical protein